MAASQASRDLAATVGRRIKSARQAAGHTQHTLAVALGSGDAMTVSRWERGAHLPSVANLVALADLFDRDPSWFYESEEMAA